MTNVNPANPTANKMILISCLFQAEVLHVHPLYLMLPATLITSYAFMLPVSTPPNAIAYSYGHLKMFDMVGVFLRLDRLMKLLC